MSTTSTTRVVAIKMNPDMKQRVKHLTDAWNRTSHWLMREAIREYVEREEKREVFRQQAVAAWHEYQATGLHVTLGKANAWLANLEASKDAKPPDCHA